VDPIKTSQVRTGWERLLATTNSTHALFEEHHPLVGALDEWLHSRTPGKYDASDLLTARQ